MQIKDRIKEFKRVKASELTPNPKNPRNHPEAQRESFRAMLKQIGFAGAELCYVSERNGGKLTLIDGHMRQSELGDNEVPCLVTDLSDQEADLLMLTFDPLASMAQTGLEAADQLIAETGLYDGGLLASIYSQINRGKPPKAGADGDDVPDDAQAEYPITAMFMEHYDYVILFASNAIDWAWLQEVMGLKKESCYKSKKFGIGRVVPCAKLRELWETHTKPPSSSPVTSAPGASSPSRRSKPR